MRVCGIFWPKNPWTNIYFPKPKTSSCVLDFNATHSWSIHILLSLTRKKHVNITHFQDHLHFHCCWSSEGPCELSELPNDWNKAKTTRLASVPKGKQVNNGQGLMQTVRPCSQVSTESSVSVVRALNAQKSCGVRGCCWPVGIVLVGRWYEHPWDWFCVPCRPCPRVAGAQTPRHPEEWRDATQHHQRWW